MTVATDAPLGGRRPDGALDTERPGDLCVEEGAEALPVTRRTSSPISHPNVTPW